MFFSCWKYAEVILLYIFKHFDVVRVCRLLNQAYVGPSRIHLFNTTDLTAEDLKEQIYLRSDDSPRTGG